MRDDKNAPKPALKPGGEKKLQNSADNVSVHSADSGDGVKHTSCKNPCSPKCKCMHSAKEENLQTNKF